MREVRVRVPIDGFVGVAPMVRGRLCGARKGRQVVPCGRIPTRSEKNIVGAARRPTALLRCLSLVLPRIEGPVS